MGYRLHVCKTYHVEYDGFGRFNYQQEEVNSFLLELCPYAYLGEGSDCITDTIEIEKEELSKGIKDLRENVDWYNAILKEKGIDHNANEFADILQHFLDNSDKRNSYVVLKWF